MKAGSVVLWTSSREPAARRLYPIIKRVVPEGRLELAADIESLTEKLRRPGQHEAIAVIMAGGREDLDMLLAVRSSFNDLRIILILPDRDQETIAKGHALRPRFLTFAGGDLSDVGAVLHKMLSKSNNREARYECSRPEGGGRG